VAGREQTCERRNNAVTLSFPVTGERKKNDPEDVNDGSSKTLVYSFLFFIFSVIVFFNNSENKVTASARNYLFTPSGR